ncbi:MAG: hypothetical protein H0Z34_06330 [Brevibacillus sp.]|nr:hypothetical protein [Brevibacillus sp.]
MFTPCIYRRAIIWVLFFVVSFFALQMAGEKEAMPHSPVSLHTEQKRG